MKYQINWKHVEVTFKRILCKSLSKKWQEMSRRTHAFPGRCRSWCRFFGSKLTVPGKAERCVLHPEMSRKDPRKCTSTQRIEHKTGLLEPSMFKGCKQLIRNGSLRGWRFIQKLRWIDQIQWSMWVSIKYVVEGGNCININFINIQNQKHYRSDNISDI